MTTVLAVLIALAIAVVGTLVGYLLRGATTPARSSAPAADRRPQRTARRTADTGQPQPPPRPAPVPPSVPQPTPGTVDDRLVQSLIGVYDTTAEDSVRGYIAQQLAGSGIRPVQVQPGSPFTPDSQRCIATEVVAETGAGIVLRTERPGWQGPSGPLRLPDVVVSAERS
ncbi:hypothetical protein GOHSU_65_00030 [Gordonia hirsuta DSM 44140 = NBRC 16056]|uniref:Uncharacterized protein n=1 Tax=Gordonia hirsuta DSM 44140 = NBRC 16056 TaxID=1121927 RepID=L7LFY0_9ACTN|nr:hypothetical protein [Gordonia hirsuta]GAC58977.1 hypothetical protein GOHSU_65_00030 [Gordonia hirsuta DSM 44140 = NBRC 16056]